MKRFRIPILLAAGVAATLALPAQEGGDSEGAYGSYDFGDGNGLTALASIDQFQSAMRAKSAEIDGIESAARAQKEKIDALWEESQNLVNGLNKDVGNLTDLWNRDQDGGGFQTKNDFDAWVEDTYNANTKDLVHSSDLSSYTKDSDLYKYAKTSDLNDYARKDLLDSVRDTAKTASELAMANSELLKIHSERIAALEKGASSGDGGGVIVGRGACGAACKDSLTAIAGYFGDGQFTVEDGSATNGCVTVTTSTTLLDGILNKLPVCFYGSSFAVGESAPVQIFEDGFLDTPLFGVADFWAGDGLATTSASDEALVSTKKKLEVCVKNPDGTTLQPLGDLIDGKKPDDKTTSVANVAAVDENGHLRVMPVGSISLGVDGLTIVRERKDASDENSDIVLKAKIANMVDGTTIKAVGEGAAAKAAVQVGELCDGTTIAQDAKGRLAVVGGGGSALKFVGTDGGDGVVVGSGSTTNTVTFASASDSNVKANVEKSGSGVKVTIGVYYK